MTQMTIYKISTQNQYLTQQEAAYNWQIDNKRRYYIRTPNNISLPLTVPPIMIAQLCFSNSGAKTNNRPEQAHIHQNGTSRKVFASDVLPLAN